MDWTGANLQKKSSEGIQTVFEILEADGCTVWDRESERHKECEDGEREMEWGAGGMAVDPFCLNCDYEAAEKTKKFERIKSCGFCVWRSAAPHRYLSLCDLIVLKANVKTQVTSLSLSYTQMNKCHDKKFDLIQAEMNTKLKRPQPPSKGRDTRDVLSHFVVSFWSFWVSL